MLDYKWDSQLVTAFHGRATPEPGYVVGYGALINSLPLLMPLPRQMVLISEKHRQYTKDGWIVLTPRHRPSIDLYNQIVFALKYEGINLLFFKKLFEHIPEETIESWVTAEPLSQYSRRVWFLYEWLMHKKLRVPDLHEGNYVPLVIEKLQYANAAVKRSSRQRISNNLPGTVDFCPLIHKTSLLDKYLAEKFEQKANAFISGVHKDILQRTSAFLLLKDSKASFSIEGEIPSASRAVRWGRAIGQAGTQPLSHQEFLRLQEIVIENSRFVKMGYRTEGGFVGEHDRSTGDPIPDHVSARWQDLDQLMSGLLEAATKMEAGSFPAVLTAAKIAFGFVFIHPLVDGNGRIHRYLIHHLLSKLRFSPQSIIFPVSAAILDHLQEYRQVLESYSHPLLDFIQWRKTTDHNVEVLNDSIDYYRYFDATVPAEFLYKCVDYTLNTIIPLEVAYLQKYDAFKAWIDDRFQMPDKLVALLVRFLEQNNGTLSKRAAQKEFAKLTEEEVKEVEVHFKHTFED